VIVTTIDLEFIVALLSFISLVFIPVLTVLIKDLTTLVEVWIKITDDGQITLDEFQELVDDMGIILKLLLKIFYGKKLAYVKNKRT
jgi:hypothetical protein